MANEATLKWQSRHLARIIEERRRRYGDDAQVRAWRERKRRIDRQLARMR